MYVVFASGVIIVCVAAPPCDQLENVYVTPLTVCGDTTPSVRCIPSTPSTEKDVVTGWPSNVTDNPEGVEFNVIVVVRGLIVTEAVSVNPCESVTVRCSR